MRPFYHHLLCALAAAVVAAPGVQAQDGSTTCPTDQAECVVEWGDYGSEIINALRNTIANDTDRPDDRVYVLERGGNYFIQDAIVYDGFDLRIVGQEAPASGNDFGPAQIQRVAGTNDAPPAQMILAGNGNEDGEGTTSGLLVRNVWLQGQTGAGATSTYEPIQIQSANSRVEFDNVVFDQNDWHHVALKNSAAGNTIVFRNNTFRNQSGTGQLYIGRGFRLEASQDTLLVENNTFFNVSSFPIQIEGQTVDYVLINHNTMVNVGLSFATGNQWKRAYITNNVFLNPFYQGEGAPIYNQDGREGPLSGFFGIEDLSAGQGLEENRRIVLANNLHYLNPRIEAIHGEFNVRTQPFWSDSTFQYTQVEPYATAAMGSPGIVFQENITDMGLTLASSPYDDDTVIQQIRDFISQSQVDGAAPTARVVWDPVAPGTPGADDPSFVNFPVPEDFSYSNSAVQSAGTDDLPLGDLNWFSDAKQTYLAGRDGFVSAIEGIAGGDVLEPRANLSAEAEAGTINDAAEVVVVEGDAAIFFENAGSAEWTFSVPADGTYGLNIETDLRGSDPRGERFLLDGVGLLNTTDAGELIFCTENQSGLANGCPYPLDTSNGFTVYELRADQLVDADNTPDVDETQALALQPGEHTLRIEPVWGYQAFGTIEVVDGSDNVVATLTPQAARTLGVVEECPDGVTFCPQGFASVALNAGGQVDIPTNFADYAQSVQIGIVYTSTSGGTGELFIDGTKATDLSFTATAEGATRSISTARYNTAGGARTVSVSSASGGVTIDYITLAVFDVGGEPVRTEELPEGLVARPVVPEPDHGRVDDPVSAR